MCLRLYSNMVIKVFLLVLGIGMEMVASGDDLVLREGLVANYRGLDPLGDSLQSNEDLQLPCNEFDDLGYFCVSNWLCREENNFTITINGGNFQEPRLLENCLDVETDLPNREKILRSTCPEDNDVCCQHPSCYSSTSFSRLNKSSSDPRSFPEATPDFKLTSQRCGVRNVDRHQDLGLAEVEARKAQFGEWPHVCAILSTTGGSSRFYKGGASLLYQDLLITAAHKIRNLDASKLIVRCGEWNVESELEPLEYQERLVKEIRVHPEFRPSEYYYDIALIFLQTEFDRSYHIQPVCLPDPCTDYTEENCVASGYGKDDTGRNSSIQKEIILPLVEHSQCQKRLREIPQLGRFFELHSSFVCAGGVDGVDTCEGDGGSPLSCRIVGRTEWFQAGIVAWGIGCNNNNPAVYANVAHASCWIDQQFQDYHGDSRSLRSLFDLWNGYDNICSSAYTWQCRK